MARPRKDNAEYFPHDAGMRNDDKIKVLRKRLGLQGYAIWNMLVEYLTGRDHFKFEHNEFTIEIIASDFDADEKFVQEVISCCVRLQLLQQEDGFIRCKTLEKKLEPVLLKRKLAKERQSVTENGKGKESKGKNSKVKEVKEPPKSIEVREKEFGESLVEHVPTYGKEMVRKFFNHWTEKNKAGKKMKFEMQKTFEIPKRLATWKQKDEEFKFTGGQKPAREPTPEMPYAEAAYQKTLLTSDAWMEKYKHQIQTDPGFKKHFQL